MTAAVSMFRGEWLKLSGNRWATTFLVWIFPVGVAVMAIGAVFFSLLSDEFRTTIAIAEWDRNILFVWPVVNNPLIGRVAVLIFAAIVFAGEYQYGTWKNLIPLRRRVTLLLLKYVTLAVFVTTAFILMTIVQGLGGWALSGIIGSDYGLSHFGDKLEPFLKDYMVEMLYTFAGAFFAASYAALAAMFTRNILASVLISMGIYIAEAIGILLILALLSWIFNKDLGQIYFFMPTFNLENIVAWARSGEVIQMDTESTQYIVPTVLGSLGIVLGWATALLSLTLWRFQRQDLQS